ncbi:hypothetical protein MTO96_041996, partial [Rhipicephalus appendiculatus]
CPSRAQPLLARPAATAARSSASLEGFDGGSSRLASNNDCSDGGYRSVFRVKHSGSASAASYLPFMVEVGTSRYARVTGSQTPSALRDRSTSPEPVLATLDRDSPKPVCAASLPGPVTDFWRS